jgi:hypothetical protein
MDPRIVFPEVLGVGVLFLALPAAAIGALAGGNHRVTCPADGSDAKVRLGRTAAALRVFVDTPHCVKACSLWPERGDCQRACLASMA